MTSPENTSVRLQLLESRMDTMSRQVWWLSLGVAAMFILLLSDKIRGQDLGKPVTTTSEAVGWALADIAEVKSADRPFQRYVWIPPWGDDQWVAAVDFGVNTAASHASVIQLGERIANGWMLRYDLRRLAPSAKQLDTLLTVWDGLAQQDPYFHVPEQVSGVAKTVIAPHLQQQEAVTLAGLSLSTGAIYRADFLLAKMLSTLEGGRYYDFLQVQRVATKDGSNPQAEWLATLGVFEETTRNLAADQRSAIFRSGVTGKPRMLAVFYGLGRGGNLVSITFDVADEDVQAGQHPIRNLLQFDDRAREIIVERPNGTHAFALTNDAGEFQDAAPDNVARDHTVPAPHTARLQPAISCIRCHGAHDGWQPFGNDVKRILSSRLDVFSDVGRDDLTREQKVDLLAGLYAGELDTPDGPIGRGRRDYSSTVYRIFGPVNPFTDAADASPVSVVSAKVAEIFASYRYDVVTPERACQELGLLVEVGQGVQGLERLLGEATPGVAVDPIAGTLRAGVAVNRPDFEAAYPDMALAVAVQHGYRPTQALKNQPKEKPVDRPAEKPQPHHVEAEPPTPPAAPPQQPKPPAKVQPAPPPLTDRQKAEQRLEKFIREKGKQ